MKKYINKPFILFLLLVIVSLWVNIFITKTYVCFDKDNNRIQIPEEVLIWSDHIREKWFIGRQATHKVNGQTYKCIVGPQDKNSF